MYFLLAPKRKLTLSCVFYCSEISKYQSWETNNSSSVACILAYVNELWEALQCCSSELVIEKVSTCMCVFVWPVLTPVLLYPQKPARWQSYDTQDMAFLLATRSYHRRWCKCLLLTCGLLLLVLWTSFGSASDNSHAGPAVKAPAWETQGENVIIIIHKST